MRYVFALLLIGGCATPEERADKMISRYGPVCDRLGYQANTDPWRDCVVKQAQRSRQTCSQVGATMVCN
jgi:hypothetical protein